MWALLRKSIGLGRFYDRWSCCSSGKIDYKEQIIIIMRKFLRFMMLSALVSACTSNAPVQTDDFQYNDERFADLQMLRIRWRVLTV